MLSNSSSDGNVTTSKVQVIETDSIVSISQVVVGNLTFSSIVEIVVQNSTIRVDLNVEGSSSRSVSSEFNRNEVEVELLRSKGRSLISSVEGEGEGGGGLVVETRGLSQDSSGQGQAVDFQKSGTRVGGIVLSYLNSVPKDLSVQQDGSSCGLGIKSSEEDQEDFLEGNINGAISSSWARGNRTSVGSETDLRGGSGRENSISGNGEGGSTIGVGGSGKSSEVEAHRSSRNWQ